MRATRRALGPSARKRAAVNLAKALNRHRRFKRATRIGVFFANDGEMALTHLVRLAWRQKKSCFLPLVCGKHARRMRFAPYRVKSRLRRNRFGIPEPLAGITGTVSARELDLVLVPLVAFDSSGNRVGMGGGFYDRTFAFMHRRGFLRKPFLMGVGYEFQRVGEIEAQRWDVALHGVCTERGVELF